MSRDTCLRRHYADRAHGKRTTYYRGCRCPECRAAEAAYQRDRRRHRKASVPATDTRQHIIWLLENGMSKTAIGKLAGVARSTVHRIVIGRWQRLDRTTADAILGVAFDEVARGCLVPTSKIRPMLEALRHAGFGPTELARITKRKARFQVGDYNSVHPHNYRLVVTLYKLLARAGRVPADLLEELP